MDVDGYVAAIESAFNAGRTSAIDDVRQFIDHQFPSPTLGVKKITAHLDLMKETP